jgi:hypothetical protein
MPFRLLLVFTLLFVVKHLCAYTCENEFGWQCGGYLRNATIWIADWRWNTSEDVLVNWSDTLLDPDPWPFPALVADADTVPGTPDTLVDSEPSPSDEVIEVLTIDDVGSQVPAPEPQHVVGDVEKQIPVVVIGATRYWWCSWFFVWGGLFQVSFNLLGLFPVGLLP